MFADVRRVWYAAQMVLHTTVTRQEEIPTADGAARKGNREEHLL
jgi:hypothetical protein